MIFKTVELLNRDEEVLEAYQERFRYIMVDEYQDTNTSQFRLISKLAQNTAICVWSVMMTSPFTNSEGRISAIF